MAQHVSPTLTGLLQVPFAQQNWLSSLSKRIHSRPSRPAFSRQRKSKMADTDLVTWTLGNKEVAGDQIIFADPLTPGRQLNKTQVVTLIRHLVAGFCSVNGGTYLQGDVVCLHDFNSIFYPVLFQGIVGAGGCFTGTNPSYTEWELLHHFRKSGAKYIITSAAQVDKVLAPAGSCGIPSSHVFVLDQDDAYRFVQNELGQNGSPRSVASDKSSACSSFQSAVSEPFSRYKQCTALLRCGQKDWKRVTGGKRTAATQAALFSTSGTSGLPKIAARTHANLIAEAAATQDRQVKSYAPVRLLSAPCFHAFAAPLANIAAIREGITTYIMARFSEKEFLDVVEHYQVTETAVVPPVLVQWLANPSARRCEQLKSIHTLWCGGAPLGAEMQASATSQLFRSDARIVQVWGLTECGWISTFHYPEHDTTGSVGRALPGYSVKLLDDDGHLIHNGRGEIVVQSAANMVSYVGDKDATMAAFTQDGWYRTGDVGEIREGKIHVVDRKKELIKVRGWQVAPAELESILLKHDHIVDVAVIGVESKVKAGEEIPHAHVVAAKGARLTEEDVRRYLLQYLARYKVADCQIVFTDSIPKSASGKILRKGLRDKKE